MSDLKDARVLPAFTVKVLCVTRYRRQGNGWDAVRFHERITGTAEVKPAAVNFGEGEAHWSTVEFNGKFGYLTGARRGLSGHVKALEVMFLDGSDAPIWCLYTSYLTEDGEKNPTAHLQEIERRQSMPGPSDFLDRCRAAGRFIP